MAQAAVEIIQEYHKRLNGERFQDLLAEKGAAVQLPSDITVENVDTRCLSLPFPPEAILPTTRLIFSAMQNKVRFALSDRQINAIRTGFSFTIFYWLTGADFIKQILNPPKPVTNPSQPTYLYNTLTQIEFPPNVTILPDKQLQRREHEKALAAKSRQAQFEQRKKEAEMLEKLREEKLIAEEIKKQSKLTHFMSLQQEYLEKKAAIEEHDRKKERSILGQFYPRYD